MSTSGNDPSEGWTPYPPQSYPPPPAGYPYGGYPGYQDPYQPTKPPGTSGTAIGALIASLCGLLCCGLSSIVGLVLGIMAMRETRRTGQDGYGLALAATIIAGVIIGIFLIYWIVVVGIYASGFQWAP